jgi:ribosome-associated translation inhibitor RaiA
MSFEQKVEELSERILEEFKEFKESVEINEDNRLCFKAIELVTKTLSRKIFKLKNKKNIHIPSLMLNLK